MQISGCALFFALKMAAVGELESEYLFALEESDEL